MPIIERMKIRYAGKGKPWIASMRCLNLSRPVGPGQLNDFGDVLLVQAFFDWILREEGPFADGAIHSGIKPAKVTGFFDEDTRKMIIRYQKGGQYGIDATIAADGVVHPASLSGRTMRFDRKQMTVVRLNRDSEWGSAKYGHDHVAAILNRCPLLKALVQDTTRGQPSIVRLPLT